MSTERCERTELLVDQCAHCRGNNHTPQEQADTERADTRRRLASDPRWFPAQYPGRCTCGETFEAGALIRMDFQAGSWISECCADPP